MTPYRDNTVSADMLVLLELEGRFSGQAALLDAPMSQIQNLEEWELTLSLVTQNLKKLKFPASFTIFFLEKN